MKQEKFVEYQTEKDYFKSEFTKAWLLVPLFGVGFFKLRKLNERLSKLKFRIYNDKITDENPESPKCIFYSDLALITRTTDSTLDAKGIANITVEDLAGEKIFMPGIKGAEKVETALIIALETEKKKRALKEKAKGDYSEYKLGGLEHMNNLVGLWQQGLITEDDFYREQEKIKK